MRWNPARSNTLPDSVAVRSIVLYHVNLERNAHPRKDALIYTHMFSRLTVAAAERRLGCLAVPACLARVI